MCRVRAAQTSWDATLYLLRVPPRTLFHESSTRLVSPVDAAFVFVSNDQSVAASRCYAPLQLSNLLIIGACNADFVAAAALPLAYPIALVTLRYPTALSLRLCCNLLYARFRSSSRCDREWDWQIFSS